MRERWNQFWYYPVNPRKLGYARAWFFAFMWLFQYAKLPTDNFAWWTTWPRGFHSPVPMLQLLHVPMLSTPIVAGASLLLKLLLFTSAIGLLTRVSIIGSFVLSAYLYSLHAFIIPASHSIVLPLLAHFALCFSRAGESFSVDRLLFRAKRDGSAEGDHSWTIQLVLSLWLLMFFAAGVSKLRSSGLAWVTEAPLKSYMAGWRLLDLAPFSTVLYEQPKHVFQGLAAFSLLTEFSAPLGFFPRLRGYVVTAIFMLLFGIGLCMGPPFHYHIAILGFLAPLERVIDYVWLRKKATASERTSSVATTG